MQGATHQVAQCQKIQRQHDCVFAEKAVERGGQVGPIEVQRQRHHCARHKNTYEVNEGKPFQHFLHIETSSRCAYIKLS